MKMSTEEPLPEKMTKSNPPTDTKKVPVKPPPDEKKNPAPETKQRTPALVPAPESETKSSADTFRAALIEARAALQSRELSQAKISLTNAQFAATPNDTAQAEDLARLRALYDYVDAFWRGVRAGVYEKSQPGEVLPGERGQDVELVKREGEQVTYKLTGQSEQTKAINRLPAPVATVFAQRGLDASPRALLSLASFLILVGVDTGQRERAKALCVEAAERGLKDAVVAAELGLEQDFISAIQEKPDRVDEDEIKLPKLDLNGP
jgi:hypothetical protein